EAAADLIGLDRAAFGTTEFAEVFSGNAVMPGSMPLSAVYSGHQFGVWAGQLGDGRAMLLGEAPSVGSPTGGMELQLKGAGKTPYSRMGDGRAVLRSSIREFLCSEAIAALGIPGTRALCVVGSDQPVIRETVETAAVVTRMSSNFVRFGSFEHWFWNERHDELKILADYVIALSYPHLADHPQPYHALLSEVTKRSAELVAHWQAVGFMHGVLNTDNMSIMGETLDYGPFGFMEAFNPRHICNNSDHLGRYAYQMQPRIVEWNCYALSQALLPLIGDVDTVKDALTVFQPTYDKKIAALWRTKLGLVTEQADDDALVRELLTVMAAGRVDFPVFFRRLSGLTC
ncbi:MAG: protein adenylyltransferase SelO, partial [Burkholderiaceae bacterium]